MGDNSPLREYGHRSALLEQECSSEQLPIYQARLVVGLNGQFSQCYRGKRSEGMLRSELRSLTAVSLIPSEARG